MSTTDPVSRSGSETVALAPNTAQHNNITPPRVGTVSDGLAALIHAIKDREHERATSLLGELCEEDKNNCATLHCALEYEFYDFVPELISSATDKDKFVTTPDDSGMTALHWAAEMSVSRYDSDNLVDIIHQLVQYAEERSKYVLAQNHGGLTALHLAVQQGGGPKILKCLIDAAADKGACLLRVQTNEGETALHYAARARWLDHVQSLVDRSGNSPDYVNMTCGRKLTALHQAALSDAPDVAIFLLHNGANATIQDEDGNTAWDIACIPEVERTEERDKGWEFLAALLLWEDDKKAEYLDRESTLNDKKSKSMEPLFEEVNGLSPLPTTNMDQINAHLCSVACSLYQEDTQKIVRPFSERISRPFFEDIGLIETLATILRQVYKEFDRNMEARPLYLRSREPSCAVRNLKLNNCKSYEFISLVVPYICVDKWAIIDQRKVYYAKETEDQNNRISNRRMFLESHMPTTLDEYCNPSLSEDILNARNKDQVLGRYEKKRIVATPSSDDKEHPRALLNELWILARAHMRELSQFVVAQILKRPKPKKKDQPAPASVILVRQAWIWKTGGEVIMTQLSQDLPDKKRLCKGWSDPKQRIAAFLNEIVGNLDSPIRGAEGSLLRTYENALIDISEEAKQYTKSSRVKDIDLDKEREIFHQISDLREELSMIKSVLTEQEEVWLEFLSLMWPNQGPDQQAGHRPSTDSESELKSAKNSLHREFLQPRTKFDKYGQRMRKLEEDAERVEKNISTFMDLKQKHATMRVDHSAALLSATVFGFTIITVIFAPLAFVAALFALPIDKFNEGKDGNNKDGAYSSGYIGKWSATAELVSIAVTLIAMWAGLRFAGLHVWGQRGLRDYIRQKANAIHTEEKDKGENNKDENYRDENNKDESNRIENNRDERNGDDRNMETEKRQQTDGLGTWLQRGWEKGNIPGVRKRTNDIERGQP